MKVMSPQNPTPVSSCPSRSSCWTRRCTTPTPRWRSRRTCLWSRTRASTPARTCPPTCSRPSSGQLPAFLKGLSHEQCWGSEMFIPDPAWPLPDPGFWILDPTTTTNFFCSHKYHKIYIILVLNRYRTIKKNIWANSQRVSVLSNQKIVTKDLKNMGLEYEIRNPISYGNQLCLSTRVYVSVIFFLLIRIRPVTRQHF